MVNRTYRHGGFVAPKWTEECQLAPGCTFFFFLRTDICSRFPIARNTALRYLSASHQCVHKPHKLTVCYALSWQHRRFLALVLKQNTCSNFATSATLAVNCHVAYLEVSRLGCPFPNECYEPLSSPTVFSAQHPSLRTRGCSSNDTKPSLGGQSIIFEQLQLEAPYPRLPHCWGSRPNSNEMRS